MRAVPSNTLSHTSLNRVSQPGVIDKSDIYTFSNALTAYNTEDTQILVFDYPSGVLGSNTTWVINPRSDISPNVSIIYLYCNSEL